VEPRESTSRLGITEQREQGQKGRLDRRNMLRSADWRTWTSCLSPLGANVPMVAERRIAFP